MAVVFGSAIIVSSSLIAVLILFAASMSDSPSASRNAGSQALGVFVAGLVIGGLVIGSHWMRLSW